MTAQGTEVISPMCHSIAERSAKDQCSKAKLARWVRAGQSDQIKGQSDKKGGQQLAHLCFCNQCDLWVT
jgi:hypothetical protein